MNLPDPGVTALTTVEQYKLSSHKIHSVIGELLSLLIDPKMIREVLLDQTLMIEEMLRDKGE